MGKPTPTSDDAAELIVEAQLNAIGSATPPQELVGTFNVAVWATGGATGAVEHQRSFDGGVTWLRSASQGVVPQIGAGTSESMFSRERGVLQRLVRVSGTGAGFFARMSQ